MDPEPVLGLVQNPALEEIAREVRTRLEQAIEQAGVVAVRPALDARGPDQERGRAG
jgi:hypothetical protein